MQYYSGFLENVFYDNKKPILNLLLNTGQLTTDFFSECTFWPVSSIFEFCEAAALSGALPSFFMSQLDLAFSQIS